MKEDGDSEWTTVDQITDSSTLKYNISKNIEYGKTYKVLVTAWNNFGESIKDDAMVKTISIVENPTRKTNTCGMQHALVITEISKHLIVFASN